MPIYKSTMWFAAGPQGWSEAFFWQGQSAQLALSRLQALASLRIACLASPCELIRCQVSNVLQTRSSLVGGAKGSQLAGKAKPPGYAVQVHLFADNHNGSSPCHRVYNMGGLPSNGFMNSGGYVRQLNPDASKAVNAYLAALKSGEWFLKGTPKAGTDFEIYGIGWQSDEQADAWGLPLTDQEKHRVDLTTTVVLAPGARVPADDPLTGQATHVLIHGLGWSDKKALAESGINGMHKLVGSVGGIVQFASAKPRVGQWQGKGVLSVRNELYLPIKDATVYGAGTVKLGRVNRSRVFFRMQAPIITQPPLPVPVLNPPVIGQPQPVVPPVPVVDTIDTARALAAYAFRGYPSPTNPNGDPINIAQIVNYKDWWLVGLSGTQLGTPNATGITQDLAAAFGVNDKYSDAIIAAVKQTIPKGSDIVLAGHSLGGMEAQSVCNDLNGMGYRVTDLITFGSPVTHLFFGSPHVVRFAFPGDIVQKANVWGVATLGLFTLEELQTIVQDDVAGNVFQGAHNFYPESYVMNEWDAIGYRNQTNPVVLQLGPTQTFSAPR